MFSEGQQVALAITPILSAGLSASGSFSIIYIILSDSSRKLSKLYHRIMLGICLGDLIASCGFATSTFLMPADTPGVFYPQGNQATCSLQGMLSNFTYISLFYSGFLVLHFLVCTLSRQRYSSNSGRHNIERFEPLLHTVPWLFVTTTTFAGLFMGLYNPSPLSIGCWIAPSPFGCQDDPDIECTRGQNAEVYRWVFGGMFIVPIMSIVTVSMITIYCSVSSQINRMNRLYSFERTSRSFHMTQQSRAPPVSRTQQPSRNDNLKEIGMQGLLYCASVIMVYMWTGTGKILENAGKQGSRFFPICFLAQIFLPLQGFFNYVIYTRPLFQGLRREHPDESRLRTWARVYHLTWWMSAISSKSSSSNKAGIESRDDQDLFDHPYVESAKSSHVDSANDDRTSKPEQDETHEDTDGDVYNL